MTRGPFGALTPVVIVVTAVLGAQLLIGDVRAARPDGSITEFVRLGRDFVNVWQGGRLALAGESAVLYDIAGYREALWAALGVKGIYAYSYPPHSLFLAAPFGLLSYPVALALWTVAGLMLFVHAARPWLRDAGVPGWTAALFPASVACVWAGHYGLLIGALSLYGWRALDAAPRRAGLAFAAMTVKPHLGVLVPLVLLARRQWSVIAVAAAAALALAGAATLVFGARLWPTYLGATLGFHADLLDAPDMAFHAMMPTTAMALIKLDAPRLAADLAQLASALVALGLLGYAARRGASVRDLGLLAASAIFLVLPYAFNYDMTAHCLATLVFAARARFEPERGVLAIAFLLPLLQMPLARLGIMIAPLVLLAALWVGTRIAVRDAAR